MKANKNDLHESGRPYTKEEFINKIKTDDEFSQKWGELGPIYGAQWRNWNGNVDQISDLIKQLKENPDSRRLIVNAWAVDDLSDMVLPPCHYSFQVYTRELSIEERVRYYETSLGRLHVVPPTIDLMNKENIPKRAISLMWNQRSVDVGLGLPFNLASYGLLLMFIGRYVNMVPDELIFNGGDTHIYSNHIEPIKEQLDRESFDLPNVEFSEELFDRMYAMPEVPLDIDSLINSLKPSDFILENYKSHPTIKLPLSN